MIPGKCFVPLWRRIAAILGPSVATTVLVGALVRRAHASEPPVLGVGAIVSQFDATTESFNVYSALRAAPPTVRGAAPSVVLVDHPAETEFAVTGTVTGEVHLREGDPRHLEHDFQLTLNFWVKGQKLGSNTTSCRGQHGVAPAPADFRFQALLPCVRAQTEQMARAFGGS